MVMTDSASAHTLRVVRYVSQLTPSSLMSLHTPRARAAFDDPDVVLLETRVSIVTTDGMSDFGSQTESRVWTEAEDGPIGHLDDAPCPATSVGYMTWTRLGQVLLGAGPELRDGAASFSLFTTRHGAMMSWTGGAHSWMPASREDDPFTSPLEASWRLGVMLIDRRASNHALLPVMSAIEKDLMFHHEVMGQIVGASFELDRIDMLASGPWPIPR